MFVRLVYESFHRQRRRKLLAAAAIALGVGVATAMVAVATDIGDKISTELRSFGANISVYPEDDTLDLNVGGVDVKPASTGAYLNEADLPKIKGIFWRNNVVAFAPYLPAQATISAGGRSLPATPLIGTYFARQLTFGKDVFTAGVKTLNPWWTVRGDWPDDSSAGSHSVLVGETLAADLILHPGSTLLIGNDSFTVSGIVSTGGPEDHAIVAPLDAVQQVIGKPGAVRQIVVSAKTKPEDAFARRNPDSLSPADRDRWYCSPYANSIARQLQEAIPHARAEQIRQVAQNEGRVLSRIQGLMLLITLAALLAASLAVSAAMTTAILERRQEVGLMKAMGAASASIAALFFSEAVVLAALGGLIGFGLGALMAQQVGRLVFGSAVPIHPVLLPIVLAMALLVTFAGSFVSIRRAMRFDPALVLRGNA